jgi:hypothetical protein
MPAPQQPRCALCGRFCRKMGTTWRCPKVFSDDYSGTWEHA